VLVATITQSCSSANAVSASLRSDALRDECDTKVRVFNATQRYRQFFHLGSAVAENQSLGAAVQPRDHRRRVGHRPDVIDGDIGVRETDEEPTIWRSPDPANQSSSSSGLPTVADSPILWIGCLA
jgi:hypothetical protein